MASQVVFWNLRANRKMPYHLKIKKLLKTLKLGQHLDPGDLVALKIHFGEVGTTGFIEPLLTAPFATYIRKAGAKPFLTDTNTLYAGERGESVSHTLRAAKHGFIPHVTAMPVIIADGIKSLNEEKISIKGKHFSTCYLAGDIVNADVLITLSHFKGHELAGFGGALKNLGMGCATRKGKMQQHCGMGPTLHPDHCTRCGACIKVCEPGALFLEKDGPIAIDPEKCVGCASCLSVCRQGGLSVNWTVDIATFLERMAEYAAAAVMTRKKPCLHVAFVKDVSPGCDCTGFSDAPICPDLGIAASFDPVALDQACYDLVNQAPPLYPSELPPGLTTGDDKFRALQPDINGTHLLAYAEHLGIGTREYLLSNL